MSYCTRWYETWWLKAGMSLKLWVTASQLIVYCWVLSAKVMGVTSCEGFLILTILILLVVCICRPGFSTLLNQNKLTSGWRTCERCVLWLLFVDTISGFTDIIVRNSFFCGLSKTATWVISPETWIWLLKTVVSAYYRCNYIVRQKKSTNFLLYASLLILDRNWWIFFTCIKESISYNSVYLIWHVLRILRNNEIETMNISR